MIWMYLSKLSLVFLLLLSSCSLFQSKAPFSGNGQLKENTESQLKKPYVVLVSFDGFRHDYVEKFRPNFLTKLQSESSYASLRPVFPTLTFPNHYSIITGMYPGHHGIVGNTFYDPERKKSYSIKKRDTVEDGSWYFGEPIWSAASKQGMMNASYFWVGSDANIQGDYPSYYYTFNKQATTAQKISQLKSWLKLPKEKRPHFITLYFHQVDYAGHRFGPDSLETRKAVNEVDEALTKINQVISESNLPINLIVTSDHGMTDISSAKKVYLSDTINLKDIHVDGKGPLFYLYTDSYEKKEEALSKLKKLKTISAYDRLKAPKRFAISSSDRAGDIILVAKPGHIILEKPDIKNLVMPLGAHGFDLDEEPQMKGIFFAKGPNIKAKGRINEFENIHVYPLIMDILGLKKNPEADGKSSVLAPIYQRRID